MESFPDGFRGELDSWLPGINESIDNREEIFGDYKEKGIWQFYFVVHDVITGINQLLSESTTSRKENSGEKNS